MKYTILVSKGPFSDIQTAAHAEERIDWWNDRQVVEQTACTLAWTATELAKYLPGEVAILDVANGWSGLSGTVILLGTIQESAVVDFCKEMGISVPSESMPAETLRMVGCQRDSVNYVLLTGADRVGAMYAAFAYLERLGVNFIEPGEPSFSKACEEAEFDVTESPSYTSRGTMSTFIKASEEFLLWMAHNRFNSGFFRNAEPNYCLRKKLGISSVVGGHQLFYLFADTKQEYPYCHKIYGGEGKPADPYPVSPYCTAPSGEGGVLTYGDAHPEWYALVDGVHRMERDREMFLKHGNAPGDNMCTSNEDAMTELCRLVLEALTNGIWKNADHVHIWPLDNGVWCQCENCKKQGNYSARILQVAYRIDKAVKEAYRKGEIKRKILLVCPAYHETLPVPDVPLPEDFDYQSITTVFYPIERCFAHDLDDPICTETNKLLLDRLLPWCDKTKYKGEVVIGEYYNVSTFAGMPFVLTSRILHEIPMYYRMGIRHFHYMHITARDWGFIAINNYVHAKLLWNVKMDGEALLDTYFSARYGALAKQMRELYAQMEATTANCKFYKHYQFKDGKICSFKGMVQADTTKTADDLFPLAHMKLRGRADDPQAGPSLEETLQGLDRAYELLQDIRRDSAKTNAVSFDRDVRRLQFGCNVTRFLYLLALCVTGEDTDENLTELRKLGEILENDTQSMQGYDSGRFFETAMAATWIADFYYQRFAPDKGKDVEAALML